MGAQAIGERLRSLRRSAGLSQAELAAGRFSKEYMSQIERGKTRPTDETLEWLADRLATDREFLEHGVSKADAMRLEIALGDAEGLVEARSYDDALRAFRGVRDLRATSFRRPSHFASSSPRRGRGFAWEISMTRWCRSRRLRPWS